jgi:hypothetical protein
MSADVIRIQQPEGAPGHEPWVEIEVKLPPPRPRIAPGTYQARSTSLALLEGYNRRTAELTFEVYKGEAAKGIILAKVPLFLTLPGRSGLSPNSKLARLLYTAGQRPTRTSRISLDVLRHKLWFVEVGDAQKDSAGRALGADSTYSVITAVNRRLA